MLRRNPFLALVLIPLVIFAGLFLLRLAHYELKVFLYWLLE